jgi:hypothetical protein
MRLKLLIALLPIVAIAVIWFLPILMRPRFDADRKPTLDSRSPATIDLAIRLEHIATLTNTDSLMSLLRGGKHVRNHMCSFQGTLSFQFPGGDSNRVAILPGHTNASYEFVCANGYYAVPRAAFMATLASAGVDTNKIPIR